MAGMVRSGLRVVVPWFMAISAGLTAVFLAGQVEIGELFLQAIREAQELPAALAYVSVSALVVFSVGAIVVVLYELEGIFLEWAKIADEDAPSYLLAHRFRLWLQSDQSESSSG